MKPTNPVSLSSLLTTCLFLIITARAETKPGAAAAFIAAHGDVWFNFWADDREEAYPFGYSNKKITEEISKEVNPAAGTSIDATLTNKHYIFEGDWYAVEWYYSATDKKTGRRQRESTCAFGRIKDGKLNYWREFFDDRVGRRQQGFYPGKLPLYGDAESPSPWPAKAKLFVRYRP
jgi:ketosteroid isomerase-like protein